MLLGEINVGVHKNSQSNNALDELKNTPTVDPS